VSSLYQVIIRRDRFRRRYTLESKLAMETASLKPSRPKSRQSIANVTSSKDLEYDKENATIDQSSLRKRKLTGSETDRKKLRSKSLGPGGLEALKESPGNRSQVGLRSPKTSWSSQLNEMAALHDTADQIDPEAYCTSDAAESYTHLR
jgi:hypothetical protein